MEDVTICCWQCGTAFTWSAEDQLFYETKGYPPPRRCRACRRLRRTAGGPEQEAHT